MALYYDAASILSSDQASGSFKSRIYRSTGLKSKPSQLYALISETAKRDLFLKEVLENAKLLESELKLTPLLALLLCHDHFFSKSGIAAPAKHPLHQAIERHKARLQSEFTRARLRRKCGSLEALKDVLDKEKVALVRVHPRWARVNTIKTPNEECITRSLQNCTRKQSLEELLGDLDAISYCEDGHIPNLLAFSPNAELTSTDIYQRGEIILQDKASCFPAHMLLGNQKPEDVNDMIDGCAAPGNKTTHLAAISLQKGFKGTIYACERDAVRSKTLESMVSKAGAKQVEVLARQDFLALDPRDAKFACVTHVLLDPSCSGSGIVGREDVPQLALPDDPRVQPNRKAANDNQRTKLKKRKRIEESEDMPSPQPVQDDLSIEQAPQELQEAAPVVASQNRLLKLSNLQTLIVEHAMKFPAAKRITYSTCSIHEQENEVVVSRVLVSDVARTRGWRVLGRDEQVEGIREWKHRGVKGGAESAPDSNNRNTLSDEELAACVRCYPDDDEQGTMGFFVCGFVRAPKGDIGDGSKGPEEETLEREDGADDGEEWEGFD